MSEEDRSALEEISIRNLGVIENAVVNFTKGLNVLTGETGAGKTMVLTALTLILGGKADQDLIRKGSERLNATGCFKLSKNVAPNLQELIETHGPEIEKNRILFSRNVGLDGKSRANFGGVAVPATVLANCGEELLEIHGQLTNLRLTKTARQRELLDRYAGEILQQELSRYHVCFQDYHDLAKNISQLQSALKVRDQEISELEELVKNYQRIRPVSGELSQLENEISRLDSIEDLRAGTALANAVLNAEDENVLIGLASARRALESIKGKDGELDGIRELLIENILNLNDIAADLARYIENLDLDPNALANAQDRRGQLNSLIKKFGKNPDKHLALEALIVDAKNAKTRISDLAGGEDRIFELTKELDSIFLALQESARKITSLRESSAKRLGELVTSEVRQLAMPHASFAVKILSNDSEDIKNYSVNGLDEIAMVFTSHSGGDLLPIAKAASGGELSRLMLALEVVIAESEPLGTYVFDEVDAGIGGKAAIEVGRRLAVLSKTAQVIVVTHLAQVAAWADNHLVVVKSDSGVITESNIIKVSGSEREIEIARMLSGQEDSVIAKEHAKELLETVRG
ncbi:MAG: DNA repair protein RecN [Acidobacteria bacterium]|nr:DNA repair protein RecN [Acidobacteriota bacterium]